MLGFTAGLLLALAFMGMFIFAFTVLEKKGLLKKYNLEMSGPFLFWKTQRGKNLIERLSKKNRFWTIYGNIGIVILVVSMILMLGLVVWSAYLASYIPSEQAPSPRLIIGIPGVNPLIPIWYGILGLATAIIVHEFSHGILARVAKIKIKTLGLIFLVVPLGAFVEPDEEEMEAMPRLKRDRLYSVGPTTNILLALVCVILFTTVFMGAVTPKEDGVIVNGVVSGSPAHTAGVSWAEQIIEIDGHRIENLEDFMPLDVTPGEYVNVTTIKERDEMTYQIYSGLVISTILTDYPGDEAGLEEGDVLINIDGEEIKNIDDFRNILDDTEAYQEISIVYHRRDGDEYQEFTAENVKLSDKYEVYADIYPNQKHDEYKGKGYLGVGTAYMGLGVWDSDIIPRIMATPLAGSRSIGDYVTAGLVFISFPFQGLSPMPSELTALYEISGPIGVLPSSTFWILANSLYWVFWLNLMVGLFNALPAVPLDGGYVFKDGVTSFIEKFSLKKNTQEKLVHSISLLLAFTILGLILWQLIGPHL